MNSENKEHSVSMTNRREFPISKDTHDLLEKLIADAEEKAESMVSRQQCIYDVVDQLKRYAEQKIQKDGFPMGRMIPFKPSESLADYAVLHYISRQEGIDEKTAKDIEESKKHYRNSLAIELETLSQKKVVEAIKMYSQYESFMKPHLLMHKVRVGKLVDALRYRETTQGG